MSAVECKLHNVVPLPCQREDYLAPGHKIHADTKVRPRLGSDSRI